MTEDSAPGQFMRAAGTEHQILRAGQLGQRRPTMALATTQAQTAPASAERQTVERFVRALAERDQQAALALYEPAADWEVHVPGGDGLQHGVGEIGELLRPWFTGRDGF